MKNTVDKVDHEHGVAELRGKGIRERTRPDRHRRPRFRDELGRGAGWATSEPGAPCSNHR
jgi:acyl-CoA hydrolase